MARDMKRQLDVAKQFAANTPVSFDLPRDAVFKEIVLQLRAQITTGGASSLVPFESSPWTLVKRIDLIVDGKDTIKSYDGITLLDLNYFDFGTYPPLPSLNLGASADTQIFFANLIISLESVGMVRPQNTWLDSRKASSLELRINFGSGNADLGTVTSTVTISTFELTPFGHEILDIDKASTFAVNQETQNQFPFKSNTATKDRYKLTIGNSYRALLINTRDSNNRAVVDRFQRFALWEQGTFNRREWGAGNLKCHNAFQFRPANHSLTSLANNTSGSPIYPTAASTKGANAGFRDGVYYINIAEDGTLNSLLDSFGYSSLELESDWTGSNTTDLIRICPRVIVPSTR